MWIFTKRRTLRDNLVKMEALGPSHLVIVQDDMDRKLGALSWKEKGSAK